jgi:ribosome maturation factor RimP
MREDARRGTQRQAPASARAGTGRGTGSAESARLARLIEPVLRAMDIDLEAVKVSSAGRRRLLRIVVDADGGVSLDEIAELSREVSARLDSADAMGDAPYTLEISSPGVDRPLTQPRHWRRAAGRLVLVGLNGKDQHFQRGPDDDPTPLQGRIISADEDRVTLDIDGERRAFRYRELGPGRVQVEFGHLPEVGDVEQVADHRAAGDFDESWNGPDEEGPDGH